MNNVKEFISKTKGKKKKLLITGTLLAAVLVAGGLSAKSVFSSGKNKTAAKIQSYEVTTGTIDSTVSATGNISMEDLTDVVVSSGVMVKEVLVETGEEVKKGDILARLDKTSVISELIEAGDTKEDLEDQLDDDLSDLEEEMIEGEIEEITDRIAALKKLYKNPVIKATADGVIASVYVSAGSETTNTVTSISSSSDSSDSSGSAGSSASGSTKSSGSSASGQTSGSSSQTAAAKTSSQTGLTSSNMTASGTTGAIATNLATSGTTGAIASNLSISGTKALISARLSTSTLSDSKSSAKDYSSQSQVITDLSALKITAPAPGDAPQSNISSTDMYSGTISWSPAVSTFQADTSYTATVILTAKEGYIFDGNYDGGTITDQGKKLKLELSYKTGSDTSSDNVDGSTGESSSNNGGSADAAGSNDNAEIAGSSTSGSNQAGQTGGSDSQSSSTDAQTGAGQTQSTQSNSNQTQNAQSNSNQTSDAQSEYGQTGKGSDQKSGNQSGSAQTGAGQAGNTAGSKSAGSISIGSGSRSISTGSGSASSSSTAGRSTEFYGTYQGAAFSINKMEKAVVTVSIDELDILSIQEGQTAKVTLDALEGQEFEGTISGISNTASSSNGNTKYSVDITIDKTDEMLDGMSASVVIVTDSAQNAVLIPVAALQEQGEKQFVYTSQEEDGTLSGQIEVETGLSDGSNVEIISGLSAGDTVYYQLASGDQELDMRSLMMQGGGPGGDGGRPNGNFGGSDANRGPGNSGNGPSGNGGPGGNGGGQ